jgi:hypothetical protein
MLRPPPARVSKITETMVLPRSVPLVSLISGGVGAVVGLLFMFLVLIWFVGFDLNALVISVGLGAFLGVLAVTWSPLKGESLFVWLGLNATKFRQEKVEINGKPVRAFIGIAPLYRTAAGTVKIISSAVNVQPDSVDERGVIVPHAERMQSAAAMLGVGSLRFPSASEGFSQPRLIGFDYADDYSPAAVYDATIVQENWGGVPVTPAWQHPAESPIASDSASSAPAKRLPKE